MLDVIAQGSEPAGGAPTQDLIWGAAAGAALTVLALWVGFAQRTGRIAWLGRLADFSARVSGLPRWAALPSAVTGGSLLLAAFGFYWDVAQHIYNGRDPGPFGTAAHYPILFGLGGIALGGLLAIVIGTGRPTPTSIALGRDRDAPLGGVLTLICGVCALSGFPLEVLQREAKGGAPALSVVAYGVLLAIAAAWLVFGLRRLQRTAGERYPDDGLAARAGDGAERDARRPALGVQA
jgi:hypothetical protein